jgi:hypothetical protein
MKGTGLTKVGEYYTINTPAINVYLIETKTGVTATNSKELVDNIAAKKELAELTEPVKSLVSNSASFYMDLNLKSYPDQILSGMKSMMGQDGYSAFQNTMSIFKDIEMKAQGYSGTMEIKLNDGSDNSLHRILVSIDNNVYPVIEKQQAARDERMHAYMMMDSIRAAQASQQNMEAAH